MLMLSGLLIFFGLFRFSWGIGFTWRPFCKGSTRERQANPPWIYLPLDMKMLPNSDHISAIVDAMYHLFSENYSDASFLSQRAIVFPINNLANDISNLVLCMMHFQYVYTVLSCLMLFSSSSFSGSALYWWDQSLTAPTRCMPMSYIGVFLAVTMIGLQVALSFILIAISGM
jgi:hypothetical protein